MKRTFGSYMGKEPPIKEELRILLHQFNVVTGQTLNNINSQNEVIKRLNNLFEKNRQTKEIKGDFINFIEKDVKTLSKNLSDVYVRVEEMWCDEIVVNDELLEYREEKN